MTETVSYKKPELAAPEVENHCSLDYVGEPNWNDFISVNSLAREDSLRSDSYGSLCCRPRSSSIPSESPVLMDGIEFEDTTFAM